MLVTSNTGAARRAQLNVPTKGIVEMRRDKAFVAGTMGAGYARYESSSAPDSSTFFLVSDALQSGKRSGTVRWTAFDQAVVVGHYSCNKIDGGLLSAPVL